MLNKTKWMLILTVIAMLSLVAAQCVAVEPVEEAPAVEEEAAEVAPEEAPAEEEAAAEADAEPAADEEPLKVGLLSPGPVNDQGWNQLAYDGLLQIEEELGAEISHVEVGESPAEYEKAFSDYASQGYDLVIGHGFQFQDAAAKVAPQFPDTVFITSGGTNVDVNLAPVIMRMEEAMYLLGVIGAHKSESGKAVGIGGIDIPAISGPFAGFKAGFEATEGNEFNLTYINSWTDVGAAKEAALAAQAEGADVIVPNANIAGQGVFQAAQEEGFWTFGTTADQSDLAPDQVLGNAVINYPRAFVEVAKSVQDDTFEPNTPQSFGLEDEGVVYITYNPETLDEIPDDLQALVDETAQQIIDGEIGVPGTYLEE
jgi:basic membrane lipoprotein Med (substrate-binding protein (PBP1-ABC) superfamily)